jgi:predicted RNA binding protein YcfA (HicA-like mRNA interferase family)
MNLEPLQKSKTVNEFITAIKKMGYEEVSRNGSSHRIFKSKNRPTLSIPHNGRKGQQLPIGMKIKLIRLITGY